ncbi:MAG: helix-turn-helix transcriptional regulator [Leptospiraceae bacterium]|nr:helix-turn-helix transcriptional regulator [Leptospiraceae bacterium]MCK6381629.1 helix-turn-helix transcriptional regulator [Leptospiraceae bacterium]NUM40812.1 helix-turn-helix transcriptional regulator [Leptospiraceae bacterium]
MLRAKKGMTQEEFAIKLKTTKSAVSRLENHAESIRLSTLEKVADVLGKRLIINFK